MTRIVDWAMSRKRLVLSALVFLFVLGVVSYVALPKEAQPDIAMPWVYVGISHPGISPEDSERLLIRPMEVQLRTIEGLKEIRSIAQQGHAAITLQFDVNFNQKQALLDVREKVDLARAKLPEDTEEPIIREFNASLRPVVSIMLYGNLPERTLRRLAEDLKDQIEALPQVLSAEIAGAREEQLEIVIDPAKLEGYGITASELYAAVSRNNRLIAAGSLDTGRGRFQVKVPGVFETREDVLGVPLKSTSEAVVTLGDVGEVRRSFIDAERFARFNGKPAVTIDVTKRLGENIIETINRVRAAVEKTRESWPEGISIEFVGDNSVWIKRSLNSLEQAVILAILLVMIVIVAALGWRSGLLVGFAIPTSFMLGFLFLGLGGYTMNMMVMFGMILAVGMLVDGGIIIVEYADRKMAEGLPRGEAFLLSAKRMFWPVLSSAATTVAAFAPMLFWPGVTGKFMEYFPITVMTVLTASTLVGLVFLPVVGSIFAKRGSSDQGTLKALAASESGDIRELPGATGLYARTIARLIRHPGKVLLGAVTLLAVIVVAFSLFGRGTQFFVDEDPEEAMVLVQARGNLSAEEKRDLVVEVEERLLDVPGIKGVFTTTGGGGISIGGQGSPSDTIGRIWIELLPYEQRGPGKPVLDLIRQRIANIAGIKAEVREFEGGPPTGKPISLELSSENFTALRNVTAQVRARLEQMEGVRDIEDSRPLPGIEWTVSVDRAQAGLFGADIASVGGMVQLVTNGIKIGEYRPDDTNAEIDIRVRFPKESRTLDQIGLLKVATREGLVPISNFIDFTPVQQVTKIDRVNAKRIMRIAANVETGVLANNKIAEIQEWLKGAGLDPSVNVRFRGASEEQDETGRFLVMAALAGLLLIFTILLVQFNNFWHCVVVLSAVVMSTIGVLLGMLAMNQTFSFIMTGTGIVALAGIIVNNNIVLVDTFQYLTRQGFAPMEAIVRTGAQRLRPVFLTTITTMAGLMPLMFSLGVNFFTRTVTFGAPETLWWVQLATAVVFGLGFATVLTLVLTPCLLALPHRLRETWPQSLMHRVLLSSYRLVCLPFRGLLSGRRAEQMQEARAETARGERQTHREAAE